MNSSDYLIPGGIVVLCLLVILVVARLTRPKAAPWDLAPLHDDHGAGGAPSTDLVATEPDVDAAALAKWHRTHEPTVVDWIAAHERTLEHISNAGLKLDRDDPSLTAQHERLAEPMKEAIGGHPAPVMRAELSALHVAGEASLFSVRRADYEGAHRHHLTYLEYRDIWIDRLRQFARDEDELRDLRRLVAHQDQKLRLESPVQTLGEAPIAEEDSSDATDQTDDTESEAPAPEPDLGPDQERDLDPTAKDAEAEAETEAETEADDVEQSPEDRLLSRARKIGRLDE